MRPVHNEAVKSCCPVTALASPAATADADHADQTEGSRMSLTVIERMGGSFLTMTNDRRSVTSDSRP